MVDTVSCIEEWVCNGHVSCPRVICQKTVLTYYWKRDADTENAKCRTSNRKCINISFEIENIPLNCHFAVQLLHFNPAKYIWLQKQPSSLRIQPLLCIKMLTRSNFERILWISVVIYLDSANCGLNLKLLNIITTSPVSVSNQKVNVYSVQCKLLK